MEAKAYHWLYLLGHGYKLNRNLIGHPNFLLGYLLLTLGPRWKLEESREIQLLDSICYLLNNLNKHPYTLINKLLL